jgi:hypothetical protein
LAVPAPKTTSAKPARPNSNFCIAPLPVRIVLKPV